MRQPGQLPLKSVFRWAVDDGRVLVNELGSIFVGMLRHASSGHQISPQLQTSCTCCIPSCKPSCKLSCKETL